MKTKNFIVVEGFDGSGKTSTAKWLESELGYRYTKSPTGAFAKARDIFDDLNTVTIAERLAFYTGDCIRVSEFLRRETQEHKVVLDRYYPSTVCYHEALRKNSTQNLHELFRMLHQPDIILYLKTDYDVLNERLRNREMLLNDNLISRPFYDVVEHEFLRYRSLPGFVEIDNNGTPDNTKQQILDILNS